MTALKMFLSFVDEFVPYRKTSVAEPWTLQPMNLITLSRSAQYVCEATICNAIQHDDADILNRCGREVTL